MYLQAVRDLRANRYFAAHPFSTSSWGTGVRVSENYLFLGTSNEVLLDSTSSKSTVPYYQQREIH